MNLKKLTLALVLLIPGALSAMENDEPIMLKKGTLAYEGLHVKTGLMPGALNVMKGPGALLVRSGILGAIEEDDLEDDIELDLSCDGPTYKELIVTAAMTKRPYTKLLGTAAVLRKFYTPAGADLNSSYEHAKADIVTEGSEYQTNLGLSASNGKIVVDYNFNKPAWLFFLYGPTVIEKKCVVLNFGESKTYETQHTTPNKEVVTLAIVAEWKNHTVNDDDAV